MLDIIIVNWNSGEQLRKCIESILTTSRQGFQLKRVMIVDNGSTDDSMEGLKDLPLSLTIIKNATNQGFAAACNQGAKDSNSDYLLFLNPDTRLFPNSLSRPIWFMQQPKNERIGVCGIQLLDESGNVSRSCSRFPTSLMFFSKMLGLDRLFPRYFPGHIMNEWSHEESRELDHVIGAFFFVRTSLFKQLGGFDQRFFVYLEDLDFSLRTHLAGWRSFYLADTQAYHKGGGTTRQIKNIRLFYSLRSKILYGYKHFGQFQAFFLMLLTLLLEPLSRIIWAGFQGSGSDIKETIRAYILLWNDIPSILKTIDL